MDEKKLLKINITTAVIVITIIIIMTIIITAYSLSQIYNANIAEQAKIIQLNEAINRLEHRNDELLANMEDNQDEMVNGANMSNQKEKN